MSRHRLLLLVLFAAPACASDFYIDPVSGSDDGDGSAAHPWRSLQSVFDDGLIETRDWPSYPYQSDMQLVVVNAGAPVRAGDTLWLRSGYHGDLVVEHAYNTALITIAAQPGQAPQVRSVTVQAAQNWIVRGLSISPSYAPVNEPTTMIEVDDHNYFGPTSQIEIAGNALFSVDDASGWGADEWVDLASSGIDRVAVQRQMGHARPSITLDATSANSSPDYAEGRSMSTSSRRSAG